MNGLIMKDFYTMSRTIKTYLFVVLVYVTVFGILEKNAYAGIFVSTIVVGMAPISAIAYDEQSKWDKMAGTMPLTAKDIVLSKYLFSLILSASAAIMATLIIYCFDRYSFNYNPLMRIFTAGSGILMVMFYHSLMLPVVYKFGTTKGRIYTMLIMFIPAILTGILSFFGSRFAAAIIILTDYTYFVIMFAVLLITLIYISSISLSVHIYKKKEF